MATLDINGRTVDVKEAVTNVRRCDTFLQVGDAIGSDAIDTVVSA